MGKKGRGANTSGEPQGHQLGRLHSIKKEKGGIPSQVGAGKRGNVSEKEGKEDRGKSLEIPKKQGTTTEKVTMTNERMPKLL